jgi:hypothetical protein
MTAKAVVVFRKFPTCFFPMSLFNLAKADRLLDAIVRGNQRQFKPEHAGVAYDFRMRQTHRLRGGKESESGIDPKKRVVYLPFQFGVRLLRKASIPSRKSSLI